MVGSSGCLQERSPATDLDGNGLGDARHGPCPALMLPCTGIHWIFLLPLGPRLRKRREAF